MRDMVGVVGPRFVRCGLGLDDTRYLVPYSLEHGENGLDSVGFGWICLKRDSRHPLCLR